MLDLQRFIDIIGFQNILRKLIQNYTILLRNTLNMIENHTRFLLMS
ncbi:hypothetical protein D8872_08045 [Streptococcus cristatus]|uniref:Uncharacterized protein n=1 Tax=Streptococcus cristatus TaxID=45634 RepID=A0A3R9P0A6_STRCR|nr:hypothetical protein D8872_08045 [Streptococcus cristatus]